MDPGFESNIKVTSWRYLKNNFIFEGLANLPIFFYEMGLGYPIDEDEMREAVSSDWYNAFMFLKILRLVKAGDVRDELKRILNIILEYFPHKGMFLSQLLDLIMTGIKFILGVHFSSCGWILLISSDHEGILYDAGSFGRGV